VKKYTIIFEWIFTEIREKQLQDLAGFAIIAGILWVFRLQGNDEEIIGGSRRAFSTILIWQSAGTDGGGFR